MAGIIAQYHLCFPKTGKQISVWSDDDRLTRCTQAAEDKGHHCVVYHRLSSSWKDVVLAWECKGGESRNFRANMTGPYTTYQWEGSGQLATAPLPDFNPFR